MPDTVATGDIGVFEVGNRELAYEILYLDPDNLVKGFLSGIHPRSTRLGVPSSSRTSTSTSFISTHRVNRTFF